LDAKLVSCIPGLRERGCRRKLFLKNISKSVNSGELDQENLNSSLCIHDARNFDEYTQVLAGDTTKKMAFLGGEEGAALCIALLCTIVLRRKTCIVYTGLKGKGLSPQVIFKKYFQICEFWRTQIQSLHCTCLLISSSSA
jgi:hypothetical protein